MTTTLSPLAVQRFYDNNNNPLVGGKLYTYSAGTTTPAATYTDATGATQNTNPVILNSRGECNVWLLSSQAYKFLLTDSSGNTIWTVDNISVSTNYTLPYVVDTGAVNSIVLNYPTSILTNSLTAGLTVPFKIANSNTGSATITIKVNGTGIGSASLLNTDGSSLIANELVANGLYVAMYDGTNFYLVGGSSGEFTNLNVIGTLTAANATITGPLSGATAAFSSVNTPNTFGFKNRIINGGMTLAQRATSASVTAGTGVPTASTGYPCVDRFFVYSTGANVTAAQVAGSGSTQYRLQITGAASVTAVGVGQRIEQKNTYDLAGSTCTLSVDLANSLLTTVTWTASYANTADTFGTINTPTKTQIATGTFTVTSTVTNYSTQISVPAAATTGIEILFTVGAQTSGTWTIGNVQLEKGAVATSLDVRSYGTELALCQRYYYSMPLSSYGFPCPSTGGFYIYQRYDFKVSMRITPV
jgi:hypothetical protein